MFPAILIIGLLSLLPQEEHLTMPREVLAPALGGVIYIGDDLECTTEHEGVWRYGRDKTLALCTEAKWRDITVSNEAR